ncbi:RNA pseudouridylate synthase [Gracilaria domingensis]|nr:RNA pseudouridylate synthase [Gracilaria domingensis]
MGRKRKPMDYNRGPLKRARTSNPRQKRVSDLDYIGKDDYVQHEGLLYVRPYVFEFRTNFKPRWTGKTVYDVFCQEFKHTEREYWSREFKEGRILCAGKAVDVGVVWQDGMEVIHLVHRHESAVLSEKIHIAHDHEGFVVVSKPPSLPIHPCGTYRRNCLQFVLKAFYGMGTLLSVHRLDKETSGLVIMAKNSTYAAQFANEIKDRKVRKTYLAEVNGIFPETRVECREPIFWNKREMKASISSNGMEAVTVFSRMSHDCKKNRSIIECRPITGRTHQIRVHLAHLGYAIVNDPLYGPNSHPAEVLNTKAVNTSSLLLTHNSFKDEATMNENRQTYLACEWSKAAQKRHGRHLTCLEEGKKLACSNCPQVTNVKNVSIDKMYIHLHAQKYESSDWSFEVPPPQWATILKSQPSTHTQITQDKNGMCSLC